MEKIHERQRNNFLAGVAFLGALVSPLEGSAQSREELLRQEQLDRERAQAWVDYEQGRGADFDLMCKRMVDITLAMFRAKEPIAKEIMRDARTACPKDVLNAIEVLRQDQRRSGILTPDLE